MSLLMKALEKAAKDRGETRKEPVETAAAAAAPAAAPPRSELSLEPLRPEASSAPSSAPRVNTPHAAATQRSVAAAAAPPREAAAQQAQASTVMQAQAASRPASGVGGGTYLRTHPLVVFGTLAALIAIGFGIYVYLQIFHPHLLTSRPPAVKPSLPP